MIDGVINNLEALVPQIHACRDGDVVGKDSYFWLASKAYDLYNICPIFQRLDEPIQDACGAMLRP
jgi:hypothetical protein